MKLFRLRRGGKVTQSHGRGGKHLSQYKGVGAGPEMGAEKEVCWLRWRQRRRVKGRCQPGIPAGGEPSSWSSFLGNEAVGWSYWRFSFGSWWPSGATLCCFLPPRFSPSRLRSGSGAGIQPGLHLVPLMPSGGLSAALAADPPVGGGSSACFCAELPWWGNSSPELLSEFPNVTQCRERALSVPQCMC